MSMARRLELVRDLLSWYDSGARNLPWRHAGDPWAVMVSEFMLQQTTVQTVEKRYPVWMNAYPDPEALAAAPIEEALRSWEGLGYYSRIRNLRAAAGKIAERGAFPEEPEELEKLPGVGPYIARAVACFAFRKRVALVEANSLRIIARLDDIRRPVDQPVVKREIEASLLAMVPGEAADVFHHALMELGQTVCRGRGKPDCERCPLARHCKSRDKQPENLPLKTPKPEKVSVRESCIWARVEGLGVLLAQSSGRRKGFWRLPQRSEAFCRNLPFVACRSHVVTRYRVEQRVYGMDEGEVRAMTLEPGEKWHREDELSGVPMASPDRKLVQELSGWGDADKKPSKITGCCEKGTCS